MADGANGSLPRMGTEIISDIITKADLNTRPFTMTGDSGQIYTADR